VLVRPTLCLAAGCTVLLMSKFSSKSNDKSELFATPGGLEVFVFTLFRDVKVPTVGHCVGSISLTLLVSLPSA